MTSPESGAKILLVEDEEDFIEALSIGLGREGFELIVARDGLTALALFETQRPDIVILDLMIPRLSGIDVCRAIREKSSVPVIMVTAKSSETDVVVGLEVGADDYITKPYRLRELVARIRAQLRRDQLRRATNVVDLSEPETPVLTVGDVTLDPSSHEVTVRGSLVTLTLREFELLEILMTNAGRVLTRELLIERIWGINYFGETKTLDVHIKRVRSKIEIDQSNPVLIVTIRGLGYKYTK